MAPWEERHDLLGMPEIQNPNSRYGVRPIRARAVEVMTDARAKVI